MTMHRLFENEILKLWRRRRVMIVFAIMIAIISIVAFGQYRQLQRATDRDWRIETQERLARIENRLQRTDTNPSWARALRAEAKRLRFHLERGIDPDRPTAPFFARHFADAAGFLLLPLLIAILASDIVSAEKSEGTDRLLLTRPIRRWKILFSKLLALVFYTTLILAIGGLLAWMISSLALDPRGWDAPTFTGFQISEDGVDMSGVRQLPLWVDLIVAYGLEWFALLTVAFISLMLSVLFRSSAASIGTMMAFLIAGTILTRISPDWTAGKYLFVSGLPMAAYYSGQAPPYPGMPLTFCAALLGIWAAAALVVAFTVFTRQDMMGA